MSDIAKWGLLAAGAALIIAAIIGLPIYAAINIPALGNVLSQFLSIITPYVGFARGLINFMVLPVAIPVLDIIIAYVIMRPILLFGIKITKIGYTWIFK